MLRIVILGDTGFIGKRLFQFLSAQKHEVVGFSRESGLDLTDYKIVLEKLKSTSPNVIINCASHAGNVHYGIENPATIVNDNLMMVLNLYKAINQLQIDTEIINLLANCSYPGDAEVQTEKEWWNGIPHHSALSYASSRRMSYVISLGYFQQFGIITKNLVLPGIYGPGDHTDTDRTHALDGMIIRMIMAMKRNEKTFEIWGSGKPIREWCFVEDLLRIINMTIKKDINLQYPVNVGQKKGYSIKKSAEIIADLIKYDGTLMFNTNYADGAKVKILDNVNFKTIFHNFTFTDFKTGIEKTVDYYTKILYSI